MTTWNPADNSDAVLSGDLLTAAFQTVDGAWRGIRATTFKNAGKWHFEGKLQSGASNANALFGLANHDQSLFTYTGVGPNGVGYAGNGYIFYNGAFVPIGLIADIGDWVAVEVDISAGLFWVKNATTNSNWYGSAAGDPATGINGLDISALPNILTTGVAIIGVGMYASGIPLAHVLNPGSSAYVSAISSGYSSWDAAAGTTAVRDARAHISSLLLVSDSFSSVTFVHSAAPPPPATQSIIAANPTSGLFTAGTGAAGTVVATMVVSLSPASPPFMGTFSLSGGSSASFAINPTTGVITVVPPDLPVAVYDFNVIVTQSGLAGSPFIQPFSAIGSPAATIVGISPTSGSFAGGAGSAGDIVATITAVLSPPTPPFSGTFALASGGDAASFTINPTTGALAVGGGDVPIGSYSVNVIPTQTGLTNSGVPRPFSITGSPASVMAAGSPYLGGGSGYFAYPRTSIGSYGSVTNATGTINVFIYSWASVPTGTITAIWYCDNNPISGQIVDSSAFKPMAFDFDTTTVPDGAHILWLKFIDWTDGPVYALLLYRISVIVGNGGFSTAAQTVAFSPALFSGISHVPRPDFLSYTGVPNPPVTARPLPAPFIAGSSSASLRDASLWYTDSVGEKRHNEYSGTPHWVTTPIGGVSVLELDARSASTVGQVVYEKVEREAGMDGGRLDAMVSPYATFAEAPDGSKWYGVDVGARLYTITHDGAVETVHGYKRNRSLLPYDFTDTSLTDPQRESRRTYVGTTPGIPPGFPADEYELAFAVDLCFDPRDSNVVYVVCQSRQIIFKITLDDSDMTVYAGSWKAPGYVDVAGTGAVNARFHEPTSIIMSDGTGNGGLIGTMYVADSENGCIRKISPDGLTVTTLVGKQPSATDEQQLGFFDYPVASITWSSAGGGTATVVLSASPTSIVALAQIIFLTGATSSGGSGPINGSFVVNGFTDNQHFTLAMPGTGLGPTLGGTITLRTYEAYLYSPGKGVSVPFVDAYTAYPQVIRFTSNNNIVLGEAWSLCCRLIDLAASTVTRIDTIREVQDLPQPFFADLGPWMWIAVDTAATCGPLNDIVLFPSLIYASHFSFRFSLNGTYNAIFGSDGGGTAIRGLTDTGPAGYLVNGQGHYPWAIEMSKHQGRMISTGFANQAPAQWRITQPSDPVVNAGTGENFDLAMLGRGWAIHRRGTVECFPFNSRPSFRALWGEFGNPHLGNRPGANTFDDLMTTFPTDATLAAYIQGGFGGSVPRPEITGNDLRDLIYFIRRNTLVGSQTPVVQPGPNFVDATPGAPIVLSLSAVRLSATSIRVDFTTNENTICVAGAGSGSQQPTFCPYPVFSDIETAYSTTHSIIISDIPAALVGSAIHYTVVVKDIAGNFAHTEDRTVI